tara:strand:+ start:3584 stop:3865 length:282 start_codon:yes stop_codon:yes gene_type:complete
MEIKLKSGRKFKFKEDITLDQRDDLMDSVKYESDNGEVVGIVAMNSTITKFLRTCIDGDTSDKKLMEWTMSERTDAFVEIQKLLSLGEDKASK